MNTPSSADITRLDIEHHHQNGVPSQKENFRFDAFVSYSHFDAAFARSLQRNLETKFGSLAKQVSGSKKRLTLFRDETDLTASGDLLPALLERIAESRKLLVICSPASRSAVWINKEIEGYRKTHGTTGNEGIVAVLLAGEDPVKDTAIPVTLTDEGREPLAVEFRQKKIEPAQNYTKYTQGDGFLRVLAPLLDLEYPDLKNRHQEYEKRRLRRNMIISTILVVVFAALSVISFLNYREADRQRSIAFSNLDDALLGYAIAARLELKKGDLDQSSGDFIYMLSLAKSLPIEKPAFALLWGTFAENFLALGDAFSTTSQFDRAEESYKVSMRIWDEMIQMAIRKSSDKDWTELAKSSVKEIGRPGEIYVYISPGDSKATVIDHWRKRLKDVTQRLVDLPLNYKK